MLTFQDFTEKATPQERMKFLLAAIEAHNRSPEVATARDADEYDAQRNITINRYAKKLYNLTGEKAADFTAENNRIASNFFHNFNTRRCTYSLGNGVEFSGKKKTKDKLGKDFDTRLKEAAKLALIHGRAFLFLNIDRVHVFKVTEFVPLVDEETGKLRAGIRYWQLEEGRPLNVTLYEEDGYTQYIKPDKGEMRVAKEKRPYIQETEKAPADTEEKVTGGKNYAALPIVPLWGSDLHQSTLVGMRGAIDAYDLIRSGFADDLQQCAEVYWILENYNGMNDADLLKFRDRLKLLHIAAADTADGGKVSAHTQEVPHAARTAFLTEIRAGMYEDFGLMDLRTLSAAATNDHIEAAYQPQDDMADDFEYQVIEAVQQLLALIGIEDTPEFKRGKVSNSKELVDMLATEASLVDLPDEILVEMFPNFTPEMVKKALDMMANDEVDRYEAGQKKPAKEVTNDEA